MNFEEFVNVSVRLKPSPKRRSFKKSLEVISTNPAILLATEKQQTFHFDHIFKEEATQEDIYCKVVKPLVEKVKNGFNCTIFAYGQTGTGKTYTMGTNCLERNHGIIPRTLEDFFSCDNVETDVHISFMEIYNEKVYDLLKTNNEIPLSLKGFRVEGLSVEKVFNVHEAKHFLKTGGINRHTGETKQNMFSSRSHAIFSIQLTVDHGNKKTCAKLNLVDLAGSESVKKTGTQGNSFQEGVNINKGLLCIGQVMAALSSNKPYIPYRQSIITTILQDSLNRNNYISLIVCVKNGIEDANDSIQALDFAQRVKKMKNKPEANEVLMKFKLDYPYLLERNSICSSTPLKRPATTPSRINHFKKPRVLGTLSSHLEISGTSINNSKSTVSIASSCNNEMGTNFSPIIRKYMGQLENTILGKLETVIQNTLKRPTRSTRKSTTPEKKNTPKYSWREIQPKVAKLIQEEVIQLASTKVRATSSPINHDDLEQAKKILVFEEEKNDSGDIEESKLTLHEEMDSQKSTPCYSPIKHHSPHTEDRFENNYVFKKPDLPNKTKRKGIDISKVDTVPVRRSIRVSERFKNMTLVNTQELSKSFKKDNLIRACKSRKCQCEYELPKKKMVCNAKNDVKPMKVRAKEVLNILNKGDKKEIQKLATIGPKTAERILLFRHFKGSFQSIKELADMPGWSSTYFKNFIEQNYLNI